MDMAFYTSRNRTVGTTVKDINDVKAKDILDPKDHRDLEGKLDDVHMILTKKFDEEDFVLEGFYRFGKKQDPIYVTMDDVKNHTTLTLHNSEAVRLLNGYIKASYGSQE